MNRQSNHIPCHGVVFEDNLSPYKTDWVMDFWELELPKIEKPVFVPPKMTEIIQMTENIGVQYQSAVYLAYMRGLTK